jgi:hypothetical protein
VVIYADDTAEVTNDRAFQRILRERKESLLTIQKENQILRELSRGVFHSFAPRLD